MSVCIAALCNDGNIVVCASDQMITAGDIQFEPPQSKSIQLTTSIGLLIAGDSALQSEICQKLYREIYRRIQSNPNEWLNVRDVAILYANYCNEERFKKAEQNILIPLGMNKESYMRLQKDMEPSLVKMIAIELMNYSAPDVETIVAGRDSTGSHIYVIRNGDYECNDSTGFASIGIGSWHANSQFMFAGYTRFWQFTDALLLTYLAKKRSEVAPGIGKNTDMYSYGPGLGQKWVVPIEIHESLDNAYKNIRADEKTAIKDEVGRFNTRVTEYINNVTKVQQAIEENS